jgi:hypothetical protein
MTMRWDGLAERTLRTLADMVPATLREDVVRGWIRTTPPEQRNGLVAVIDELGVDVELFADDLQSDEGWPDAEGEPEPDGM